MNAKHVLALACAAYVAAGLAQGVVAAQSPGSDRFHPASAEQARASGIQLMARSFGITPEAAASRLNVEEHTPDIVERIRTQYVNRLAGIYIEHAPTHRLVVRLTGFQPVRQEFYQFDNGHAGSDQLVVDYQVGAEHTFADLQERFENGFGALKARLPVLQSGYVDERTGQIVLEVVADKKTAASLAVAQRQLADNLFGASTRIVPMGRITNQAAIKGSGNLAFTQATLGGGVNLTCTGAFTVKDNSTPAKYGLLTAGHCQASSGSYNYTEAASGPVTATLTHVARRFDAATDVGWAMISTSSADAVNSFYAGSAQGGWQAQGLPLSKASTTVGSSMCHYGATTTAGSCGTVASTAYNPGSICGTGLGIYTGTSACTAVYVAVDSMACAPSDSGGPVYTIAGANYRPAGIHKAGNTSSGRCVYSSIDDIYGSPLNLQTL